MKENDSGPLRLTPIEEQIFRLALPYLQVRDNELHTWNAVEFSMPLLEKYGAERKIVVPAVMLHDVGWSTLPEDIIARAWGPRADKELMRLHEEEGAKIARQILHQAGYDQGTTTEIATIISGHDTRTSSLSLNDEIVKDSDKLTRYSHSFWFMVRQLSLSRDKLIDRLEPLIDEWFFLDLSRNLARAELALRRVERDQR